MEIRLGLPVLLRKKALISAVYYLMKIQQNKYSGDFEHNLLVRKIKNMPDLHHTISCRYMHKLQMRDIYVHLCSPCMYYNLLSNIAPKYAPDNCGRYLYKYFLPSMN